MAIRELATALAAFSCTVKIPEATSASGTVKPEHHAAILDPIGVGGLMRVVDGYTGQPTTRLSLMIAPRLFVRPGELRTAEGPEFDFESALWRIPDAKMKLRIGHLVPLSRQALRLLEELRALTSTGRYLFPSLRTRTRCMSENTINAAFCRLGYSQSELTGLACAGWPQHY